MAGTRLYTQISFVLGVLALIPPGLWLLLPPCSHYLWAPPLRGEVPEPTAASLQEATKVPLRQPVRVVLMNEDPGVVSCAWDFGRVVSYLEEEKQRLEPLTRLSFMGEVTNYGTLPAGSRSQAGGVTVLDIESLSSWSVEIEDTLPPSSAHGPTRPLQVVVFCPSTGPLQFSSQAKEEGGGRSDAMFVPGVGGAMVLDGRQWGTAGALMPDAAHYRVAEVLAGVVRMWLGMEGPLPPPCPNGSLQVVDDSELSQLLHQAYASRLAEAASTLRLIQQVMYDPRGRVLSPRVIGKWHASLQALNEAQQQSPPSSKNFSDAMTRANEAAGKASEAWSDPSLVPPPHFPAEHHVAVLVPLIVPLLVPVLGGLKGEWRRYKEKVAAKRR